MTALSLLENAGFTGELVMPEDAAYDEARSIFNAMIDRRPAVIARCAKTTDVVAAVNAACESKLPLSVLGGGHAVTGAGLIDDGICIDLRTLDAIAVDDVARVVRVGGGCRWGALDAATQEHGLAVTGGRVSTTGVGGLTLGSGSGWLERKFGFACDNLLSCEVVTADGKVVTASNSDNPDLFWALRGGGGNFGVVTEFTFQLHQVGPMMLAGLLVYPAPMAADVAKHWRDFMSTAPNEVASGLAFITAPPLEFVPEPARGQQVLGVVVLYVGDMDEGRQVLTPLLDYGPPAVNLVQPMPYLALQQLIDEANPPGRLNYWTADFLAELPDKAIDELVELAARPVSPFTQLLLVAGGGAISEVDDEATAFGQRDAPWNVHWLSAWENEADSEKNIAYTREVAAALKPWTTGKVYLNYIGEEGSERVASSFGPEKYARLRQIKKVWDPTNLFSQNQNIPPAD